MSSDLDYFLSESWSSSLESSNSSPPHQVPDKVNQSTELQYVDCPGPSGPYLRIVEEPQDQFRFRYKSENGAHGCIMGITNSNNNVTHPTVELVNYDKQALLRCRLVEHERNDEHPHQLLEDEDEERDVSARVPLEGSYRVGFPGMGIIHTAKKDVAKELHNKYVKDRHKYPSLKSWAHCLSEAKRIDLNIVRLKFSAHDYETDQEICAPVFSTPIYNIKSPATNELKICYTSRISGKPKGGDDVIILVEKVSKKNIEIHFVERNQAGDQVWMDRGRFLQSDVHHQYGIRFRTPAYDNPHLTSSVKVCMELFRPTDGRRSNPIEFTYRPDPLAQQKEKSNANSSPYAAWSVAAQGTESIQPQPELPDTVSDMSYEIQYMEIEDYVLQQLNVPQIVQEPSNVSFGDELGFVSGQPVELESMAPQIDLDDCMVYEDLQSVLPPTEVPQFNVYRTSLRNCSPDLYNGPYVSDSGRGRIEPQGSAQSVANKSTSPSRYEKNVLQIAGQESNNEYTATYSYEHGEEVRKVVKEIYDLIRLRTGIKKQDIKEKLERLFQLRLSNGDTFLHMALWTNRSTFENIGKLIDKMKMPHLLNLTNDLGQTVLHLAVVRDIPEYMSFLISKGCDPSIGDKDDNTAVHLAVQHQACAQPLLAAIRTSGRPCDLDAQNKDKQTALHLAAVPGTHPDTVASSIQSIELLLQHGASHNARDHECRTPLHLAVYDDCLPVVRALLKFIPQSDIDVVDGNGNTALQIACGGQVRDNTVDIVKLLIEKKAAPLAQCGHAESAWRLTADKPPLRALLAPLVPADAHVKDEPKDDYESADEGEDSPEDDGDSASARLQTTDKPQLVAAEADVKSEPEDDYESADEGVDPLAKEESAQPLTAEKPSIGADGPDVKPEPEGGYELTDEGPCQESGIASLIQKLKL